MNNEKLLPAAQDESESAEAEKGGRGEACFVGDFVEGKFTVLEEVTNADEADALEFFIDGSSGGFFKESIEVGVGCANGVGDLLRAYVFMAVFSEVTQGISNDG